MIPLIDWSVLPVGAYLTGVCGLKVVHLRLDGLNRTHGSWKAGGSETTSAGSACVCSIWSFILHCASLGLFTWWFQDFKNYAGLVFKSYVSFSLHHVR